MSGQLEKQLGELHGILQGLPPALNGLEKRQNETEQEVAAVVERIDGLRREFDNNQTRVSDRLNELYGKCNAATTNHQNNANEIGNLEKDIKDLKEREKGWTDKAWDMFKILAAAGVSAWFTWKLSKGG